MVKEQVREEIIETVRRINAAWLEGGLDELETLLHPDMVVVRSGFATRSVGMHAAIDGYRDLAEQSEIRDYRETNHVVDAWDDTAVVTYHFEIDYSRDGETRNDAGVDIFVLQRAGDGWCAVWRTVVPES